MYGGKYFQGLLEKDRHNLPEPDRNWPETVQRAVQCIHENLYVETLTVTSLKEKCRISGKSFDTKFSMCTGLTPKQYIIYRRLAISKKLLLNRHLADISLTQVALSIGFTSYSAFAKTFLNHEGCSPRVWRKQNSETRHIMKDRKEGIKFRTKFRSFFQRILIKIVS